MGLSDEVAHHGLSYVEVGDDAVFMGLTAIMLPECGLSSASPLSDCEDILGVGVNGTTDGSTSTIPLPLTCTRVLAVPRSIPMSLLR